MKIFRDGLFRTSLPVFLPLLVPFFLTISGCSLFIDTTGTLWTNEAEIAAYIEQYNAQQEEYRIEVEYKPAPAEALRKGSEHPDMIICERIVSREVFELLNPLDSLFEKELLDPSLFYPGFFELGTGEEGEHYLLPVSFSIPAMMFKPSNMEGPLDNFFISFREIREQSSTFDKREEDGEITHLGFSPDWDIDFLYLTTVLFGTNYRETSAGELAWNNSKLTESIHFIRDWIGTTDEEKAAVNQFNDKYMYDPDYKLINNDRILCSYTDIKDYLLIPQEKRTNLDFRWIAKENQIHVSDDLLFFGIPKKGRSKKVVESFVVWFFNESTQRKLMETALLKRMRSFGIAKGFSAIPEVNERHFQRYYPDLIGHIPTQQYLRFPTPLPLDWPEIKEEVLKPWLQQTVHRPETESFGERLNTWLLQKPRN